MNQRINGKGEAEFWPSMFIKSSICFLCYSKPMSDCFIEFLTSKKTQNDTSCVKISQEKRMSGFN